MTSRLRDVLAVTIALYCIAFGLLLLVDTTGLRPLGTSGIVGGGTGLALIALGILTILAAIRARRFARRLSRTFGHVRSASAWTLDDAVIRTIVGDITLDLRNAELPDGETQLTLLCWLGEVKVLAPPNIGLDVEAQTIIGAVDVFGRREDGFIRDVHARTEGYDCARQRLQLRLSTVIGEASVQRRA